MKCLRRVIDKTRRDHLRNGNIVDTCRIIFDCQDTCRTLTDSAEEQIDTWNERLTKHREIETKILATTKKRVLSGSRNVGRICL